MPTRPPHKLLRRDKLSATLAQRRTVEASFITTVIGSKSRSQLSVGTVAQKVQEKMKQVQLQSSPTGDGKYLCVVKDKRFGGSFNCAHGDDQQCEKSFAHWMNSIGSTRTVSRLQLQMLHRLQRYLLPFYRHQMVSTSRV